MNNSLFVSHELDFIYYLMERNRLTVDMAKELKNVLDYYILKNEFKNEETAVIGKIEFKPKQPLPEVQKEQNTVVAPVSHDHVLKETVSNELENLVSSGEISPDDMMKFKSFFG